MTNDAKHPFMCLLTFVYLFLCSIHLYLLNILNELFFLFLKNSLNIPANIFSQFVACHLI